MPHHDDKSHQHHEKEHHGRHHRAETARPDKDEAGIHKTREAPGEGEARTPTRGEPSSESDRTGSGERPTPASKPTEE